MEYLTLARVYLAQQRPGEAATALDRLLPVVEAQGYLGSVMEILMLQALTEHAQGDVPESVSSALPAHACYARSPENSPEAGEDSSPDQPLYLAKSKSEVEDRSSLC